mgnify:CR=1
QAWIHKYSFALEADTRRSELLYSHERGMDVQHEITRLNEVT